MSDRDEIDRLTARLDRERRARREAELIAERGLREYWQLNSELEARVVDRTAELQRELAGHAVVHEFVAEYVMSAIGDLEVEGIADRLGWIEVLNELPRSPTGASSIAPVEITDWATRRWQLVLARSGHLLSFDVDHASPRVRARWDVISVALDLLLASTHRRAEPGAVTVGVTARLEADPAMLAVTVDRPPGRVTSGPSPVLITAGRVVERYGGTIEHERLPDALRLELLVPIEPEPAGPDT